MVVVTRDPQPEDEQLAAGRPSSLPDPKALGRWIVQDAVQTRVRLLAQRGYVVRDAGDFLLATPPDLLGVPQARSEIALLRDVAKRAAAGERVLAMKDLPKDEAQALRSKLADYQEPHNLRVKNAPYLRFGIETRGVFDVQSGRMRKPLDLLPGTGLSQDERKSRLASVMHPDAEDAAAGIPPSDPPLGLNQPKDSTKPIPPGTTVKARSSKSPPKGRLTFVVPTGLPGDQGLEWMGKAQAILLKEAHEARTEWKEARDGLLDALKKEADAPFVRPPSPGRVPSFDDLTPEAQQNAAQYFNSSNQSELGGQSARDWLRGAQYLDYRVEPVLTMKVAAGSGWYVNIVPFECPIGP